MYYYKKWSDDETPMNAFYMNDAMVQETMTNLTGLSHKNSYKVWIPKVICF